MITRVLVDSLPGSGRLLKMSVLESVGRHVMQHSSSRSRKLLWQTSCYRLAIVGRVLSGALPFPVLPMVQRSRMSSCAALVWAAERPSRDRPG